MIRIHIDRTRCEGSIDLVGEKTTRFSAEAGRAVLAGRAIRKDLAASADLPDDTRLWAALQLASGGTWAGCVYDTEKILTRLRSG